MARIDYESKSKNEKSSSEHEASQISLPHENNKEENIESLKQLSPKNGINDSKELAGL